MIAHLEFVELQWLLTSETGVALTGMLGIGWASGDSRARDAVRMVITSPLLQRPLADARCILIYITCVPELRVTDMKEAVEAIAAVANPDALVLFNAAIDRNLKHEMNITALCLYSAL